MALAGCSPLADTPLDRAALRELHKAGSAACEAEPSPEDPAQLTVWIEVEASPEDEAALGARLTSLGGVEGSEFHDRNEAYTEFAQMFADAPEIVEQANQQNLPARYSLQFDRLTNAEMASVAVAEFPSVSSIDVASASADCRAKAEAFEAACNDASLEVLSAERTIHIWLDTEASPGGIAAVEQTLKSHAAVKDVVYIDQEEQYRRFAHEFADDPALVDLMTPDSLPVSFEAQTITLANAQEDVLFSEFESLPGVDNVNDRDRVCP